MAVLLIKLQLLWNLNSPNARTDLHQHSTFSINLPNADRLKFSFVLWRKGILTCWDKDSLAFIYNNQPDSIPVGCIPPPCQPYVFQWPPLDVSTCEGWVGPQVNNFEQSSSDNHQMSVAG